MSNAAKLVEIWKQVEPKAKELKELIARARDLMVEDNMRPGEDTYLEPDEVEHWIEVLDSIEGNAGGEAEHLDF